MLRLIISLALIAAGFTMSPESPVDRLIYLLENIKNALQHDPAACHSEPVKPEDRQSIIDAMVQFVSGNNMGGIESFVSVLSVAQRCNLSASVIESYRFDVFRALLYSESTPAVTRKRHNVFDNEGVMRKKNRTPEPVIVNFDDSFLEQPPVSITFEPMVSVATINPEHMMITTSSLAIRDARHIKDSSGINFDTKESLINILERKIRPDNTRVETLPLIYLEHRLFELAKRGNFSELLRIEKWLHKAYSKYSGQVFTSAYRRLLDDSYEFPKLLINVYENGITKMQEYYTLREVGKITFKRELDVLFSTKYQTASIEGKGASLELELYSMSLDKDWETLQYALNIFQEAKIGKGIMQQLFERVYQIVRKS